VRAAGLLAFASVMVSGLAHLALSFLPRPWSTLGHIDIAELLDPTPIFRTHWPYWTFPFEYHPVVGWGSALISFVTGELAVLVVVWLAIMALCARAVALELARRVGPRRTIVFWSLSPQLLLFGGANFDALAVLTVVYAASALRADRAVRAGVSIAVGAATKLFPLVALPPYVLTLWHTGRGRNGLVLVTSAAVALLAIDLPAVIAPYSLLGHGVTPFSVATWNVDSMWFPVAILLDTALRPDAADTFIAALSVGGLTLSYAWLVLRPALRSGADAERLAWLGVAMLVFWTRLRSPQYAIWLLPLFALYVPDARLLLAMLVGDAVTFAAVFGLRGAPRELLGPEALPFYAAIVFGVIVRQVAVARVLLRAR
jgi:hypothetical protein